MGKKWIRWIRKITEEGGVTLIELLAVVVILAIVSAISVPIVSTNINNAKVNATEMDIANIQQALERYNLDHGQYPATLTPLAESTQNSDGTMGGPYLAQSFPEPDSWNNDIIYDPIYQNTTVIGYYILSGGGQSVTPTSSGSISPTNTSTLIWAAGGTDSSNDAIGSAPHVGSLSSNAPSKWTTQ